MTEPVIYDIGRPGLCAMPFPAPDVPRAPLPDGMVRDELRLPEASQLDVVRHFTRLSALNHSIDKGFYPLGSCTMKYNPRINEDMARLAGFAGTHPMQDEEVAQGNLHLMFTLQEWLKEIGGFAGASLQPAAGAHGEFAGILMVRAYHLDRGDTQRRKILIPDSAHGTNPASTAMSGYSVVEIPSDSRGNVDLAALRAACDDHVAGLMLTNPNTLGLFDEHVQEVVDLVHGCGGLVYGDGANMNALLGIARPGDLGFDILHYNLHKTFGTPHGGGGPGSGPVAVCERLAHFLPGPIVERVDEGNPSLVRREPPEDGDLTYYHLVMPPKSIGRVKVFHGHMGIFVRAYAYIRMHGPDGLRRVAEHAVLNANYLQARVGQWFPIPQRDRICMHEFVAEGTVPGSDVRALDISKRLMDFGIHPPTNYFPLIVHEALMIEPTETESKATLDTFAAAMAQIAREAVEQPELLHQAPHTTPVSRMDEVKAARELVLSYWNVKQ
jgi:glycine dehydrogenase subunit 2